MLLSPDVGWGQCSMNLIKNPKYGMEALALLNEACTQEVAARSSKEPAKVKVYPNPTGGTLYIQHTGIAADHILITDILGQIRYEADIDMHTVETTIELSNLPAGVYQYQLLYRKGIKDTGKFIRIH